MSTPSQIAVFLAFFALFVAVRMLRAYFAEGDERLAPLRSVPKRYRAMKAQESEGGE